MVPRMLLLLSVDERTLPPSHRRAIAFSLSRMLTKDDNAALQQCVLDLVLTMLHKPLLYGKRCTRRLPPRLVLNLFRKRRDHPFRVAEYHPSSPHEHRSFSEPCFDPLYANRPESLLPVLIFGRREDVGSNLARIYQGFLRDLGKARWNRRGHQYSLEHRQRRGEQLAR